MGKVLTVKMQDDLLKQLEGIFEKCHPPRANFSSINRLAQDMFDVLSETAAAVEKGDKEEERELEKKASDYLMAIELLCEQGTQRSDQMNQDVYVPLCRILKSLGGSDYPDYELIYNLGDPDKSSCNPARMKEELEKIKD